MIYTDKPEPEGEDRRGRGGKKRWTQAPPPASSIQEIEGACILDEVQAPLGLALWQRFRDIQLWATGHLWFPSATRARRDLFAEQVDGLPLPRFTIEPGADKALSNALRTFAGVVLEPWAARDAEVAAACVKVAEWAMQHGHLATGGSFFALAATVCPSDTNLAFRAGKAERVRGRLDRSADWFRRAVSLARSSNDHPGYIDAYLGLGVTEERRGRRKRAAFCYVKAYRRARQAGLPKLGGWARHNLIALSAPPHGTLEEALAHAQAAFRLYGRSNPRIPALAADFGALCNEHSFFSTAMPVLLAALPHLESAERVAALANLARSAAATRHTENFFLAWDAVTAPNKGAEQFLAAALAEVAEAARNMNLTQQAFEIAAEALRISERRHDEIGKRMALDVQEAIRESRPKDEDREAPPAVVELAAMLVAGLRPNRQPNQ